MVNTISSTSSSSSSKAADRARESGNVTAPQRDEKRSGDPKPRLSSGTSNPSPRPTSESASGAYARHNAGDVLRRAQLDARRESSPGPRSPGPRAEPTAGNAAPRATGAAAGPHATTAATATPTSYPPEVQEVVDLVKTGTVDDATRTALADKFKAMDGDTSHAAMEAIRAEGLQDTFLDQVLRDENGKAVDPRIKTAVSDMMNTGRVDVYAETLASTSFNMHDPAVSGRLSDPHFDAGDNGLYFTDAQLNDPNLKSTMVHETFHAFSNHHGGPTYSAMDEGLGISAIHYAYENGTYSTAEAVYGTANYYRDDNRDPNYPMGSFQNADPKLAGFLDDIQARDRSGLDWRNDKQIVSDYTQFWEKHHRFEDADKNGLRDWEQPGGLAEQAEAEMIAARTAPPPPKGAVESFFDWVKGWLGW
jgi:hypothetical protein